MKRIVILFASLFLTPIGIEDTREVRSIEAKNWKKVLRTYVRECDFPHQEIIEPLFCESSDSSVGRV
ncbi:hypothetical protein C834K_0083 [Chlamydia poikilotherma]|uniref:Uncharacterized protein n=1 Tax=Chlamydia poikilotherma TaxID=1967783 RepID=A0A3B0PQV1_9CHLA|nr:hypothetical protein [Chlamydia poikilotherma]SYX08568.1 hypothetical protein C834K_0083 [Chlamydia poikilotherma]